MNNEEVRLLQCRRTVRSKIQRQIDKGRNLLHYSIKNEHDLEYCRRERSLWLKYTHDLLKTVFASDAMAKEFYSGVSATWADPLLPLETRIDYFREDVQAYTDNLASIVDRLKFYKEHKATGSASSPEGFGGKVFVVHGHDEASKQTVARWLETLDLDAVILHEQPHQGRTIIEKLEDYSAKVDIGYAVIILTPDDVGGVAQESPRLNPRARQNVIFELGYFIGRLGRGRVCALYSEGVELPSDYAGVSYIKLDEAADWRLQLAREVKAAGLEGDLNKMVNLSHQ